MEKSLEIVLITMVMTGPLIVASIQMYKGTIHKRRRQCFRIFEPFPLPLSHVDSLLVVCTYYQSAILTNF